MNYLEYSSIPYFVITVFLILLSWIVLKLSCFYRELCSGNKKSRFDSIDGLRGFLALAVFFHHAVINQHYFQTWRWEADEHAFYPFIAGVGVSTFFMITGFLFWNKVIVSEGNLNLAKFYGSRINRLAPMYFFSVVLVIVLAFASRRFEIWDRPDALIKSILSWSAFGLLGQPNINQVPGTSYINAGVVWTLAYEWKFYFALPFIALFWQGFSFFLLILIMYSYSFWVGDDIAIIKYFSYGMIVAYILNKYKVERLFSKKIFSMIAASALVVAYFAQGHGDDILYLLFFMIIAGGNSFFGLFTNSPAKVLGVISYSVYLLHGIVLFVVMTAVNKLLPVSELDAFQFWLVVSFCGLLTVVVSIFTYRFIEHPCLIRERR